MVVKGQVGTNFRGGGQTCQIGKGGDPGKGGETPTPQPLSSGSASPGARTTQEQTRRSAAHAGLSPREALGAQPPAREPGRPPPGAPADAIVKAKMAAPRKPAPRR